MKYFYTFLFCFLFVTLSGVEASAQTNVYHPFPDTNAIWAWRYWDLYNPWIGAGEVRYGMRGDTIINGKNYKKIYSILDTTVTDLPYPYPPSTYYAAIREQNKRIYTVIDTISEQLLYDFNLSLGDTITYHYSLIHQDHTPFSRVVTKIDSTLLLDGKYRKRWALASGVNCGVPDSVVEGVGSILSYLQGLFTPLFNDQCTCATVYQFTCFKNNDTTLYANNTLCNRCFCTLYTAINNVEDENAQIKISPNPSAGIFILRTSETNSQLCITNILGEKIYEAKTTSQETKINLENFNSGIYFLTLKNKNGAITKKIVKN